MGSVYRVDDLTLGQQIAIKFLDPRFARQSDWVERFRNEVRLARRVSHPNVCRVFDIGESSAGAFLSMEYIEGENLAALMRRIGRLSFERATDVARQICTGLAAAHGAGVLHRDLKPENIMLDGKGRVRVTDFGIAVASDARRGLELRVGTPAYMAPEQIGGRSVDIRSDIYAVGLVLYELFSGRPAFRADSIAEYARRHEHEDPEPLSKLVPDVDPKVEALVRRCLAKDPSDRPASALAVAASLPGVDVLSVAISANQTPAPALVADASAAFRLARPGRFALIAVASCLILPVVRSGADLPWERHGAKPPAVLAERAGELLTLSGHRAAASAVGYCAKAQVADLLTQIGIQTESSRNVLAADDELLFWCRAAPEPLIPQSAKNLLFGNARVSLLDPPFGPGQQAVVLDQSGWLRGLFAFASTEERENDAPPWGALFTAAGLSLPPAGPMLDSSVVAMSPQPCFRWPEVATERGRVEVRACSTKRGTSMFLPLIDTVGARARWTASRASLVSGSLQLIFLLVLIASFPLAWRNHIAGRADVGGAVKTGGFVFCINLVAWLIGSSHTSSLLSELSQLVIAFFRSIGLGAVAVVLYLGLEPSARRNWPHLLIGWTRLLRFRRGDAVVWDHVLVGIALGCFWALLASSEWAIVRMMGWSGGTPWLMSGAADRLLGGGAAAASYLHAITRALLEVFLFAAMLGLARSVVRNPLWAAFVVALTLIPIVLPRGAHPATAWLLVGFGVIALGVWTMVRVGLLALGVAATIASMLNAAPFWLHSPDWSRVQSVGLLAFIGIAAAYAFSIARRARPA